MEEEIKEKLLKELQEIKRDFPIVAHLNDYQRRMWENAYFIEIETKVKEAIEETSKAKDEEFDKILDDIDFTSFDSTGSTPNMDALKEEIKRRKQK